jgi:Flp pilus assembly protein TadB
MTERSDDTHMNIRPLAWLLVALGGALGIVLVVRGNVVIGALICAMAGVRALLLVRLRRRFADFRNRFPRGRYTRT